MPTLTSTYDNEWTITVNNSNASFESLTETKGGFVGNGKLGFLTAFDKIGVQKSIISVDFDFNEMGLYTNNVTDAFDFCNIKLFDNKSGPESITDIQFVDQSLNMYNGISTTNFIFNNNSDIVNVSVDFYPVRHLPYCAVQTLRFTPQQNMSNLDVFHEISCGENIIIGDYNNNVIYNELVNPDQGMYMLTGKGTFKDTGKKIAVSSTYICNESNFATVGFNRYAKNPNKCYQKTRFTDLIANTTYKLSILTSQMTEFDFKFPEDEAKRITINVAHKLQNSTQLQQLRDTHVASWFNMWKSNINIEPKIGITTQETTDLNAIKRLIRYSLYNIWSSVREGVRTEVNPASLSVIDSFGTLFWDGDLWFIPVLIIFRPDIAKTVLEARYRVIDRAIQLAQGYGFSGSKYPYVNDVSGYINGPYWDLNGPMHIFNTALINISVWNYYRLTQDKDWMTTKGYTIMKNNADFFASKAEVDEDGVYHINNVYSFHDKISNDNALTNYLIKTALKYTIEASYELNIVPREKWEVLYFNLDAPFFSNNPIGTIQMDNESTDTDEYKFLEMLIPMMTYYSETYLKTNLNRTPDVVETNLNFYKNKVATVYQSNPLNNMIIAWLNASLTNYDSSYPDKVNDSMIKILNENVQGVWGHFSMDNASRDYNDLSLSSMFILMLLTTLGTLKIAGSVSETRFYSESMGLRSSNTSSMPKTWKNLRLTGIGSRGDTYSVLNQVYYP